MAGIREIEALQNIYSEVDASHIKVSVSTECIKAQAYLQNKFRKKAEQSQEVCGYILAANLKVDSEINHAQKEITSMLVAHETIKKYNVDLKKELLLANNTKQEVIERVENNEKKYENIWLESKSRYESLPFVQKLLKARDEVQNIKQQISKQRNDEKLILEEIKKKTNTCREIDRKRIIQFAKFTNTERPQYVALIKEKSAAINKITEELNNLDPKPNENNDDLKAGSDCTSIMPKLERNYFDFDNSNKNLEKIKENITQASEKTYTVHSIIVVDPSKVQRTKTSNTEEYISSFFYNPVAKNGNETQNYAKKKLINILDDIKVDKIDAQRMISDVNPDVLQPVHSISVDDRGKVETNHDILNTKDNNILESEEIEVVDLTASGLEKVILPPTQFLDMTSELEVSRKKQHAEVLDQASTSKEKISQEELYKKRVTFDLPNNLDTEEITDADKYENEDGNETINSQLDPNDDGFDKIRDVIMKERNLNLSPHFVYAKNVMTPLNLHKSEDAVVTSKFFPQGQNQENNEIEPGVVQISAIEEINASAITKVAATPKETDNEQIEPVKLSVQDTLPMEIVGSPKQQKVTELTQAEKPISGSLFGQSSQMTCDYLEESTNTTLYGDGDDIPSYLDTSLLMSPKADLSTNVESQETLSQDVPNFLKGLRKTGFSFFGCPTSASNPDSSGQNQNQGASGFSFNFGGEDKKTRGGLFNMFQ